MDRIHRAVVAATVAAMSTGIALVGCSPGSSKTSTTSRAETNATLTAAERRHKSLEDNGEIAKLGPGTGPNSTVMWPQTNGWQVCDGHRCTDVSAGAVAQDHSTGWFIITRYRKRTGAQLPDGSVKIPDSGPVRITEAPLGHKVSVWAQRRGNLRFRGKTGVTGTLHLRNGTVALDP